jgi:hypothetical protein
MAIRVAQGQPLTAERRFFAGMAVAMAASIMIGFLPSYYLRGVIEAPVPLISMTPLVHIHGALFTAWMLLFVAQVLLVSANRRDIHMRLGVAAFAMLPVMIAVGTLAALHQVARASGPPITDPLNWLSIPLLSVPLYAGLIGTALAKRRDPASHKRFMMIAMIEMTTPGLGRIPWPPSIPGPIALFGFSDLFLVALAAWDIGRTGRLHRATAIGGGALLGSQLLRLAVWGSPAWLAFARWAVSLVN